MINIIAVNIKQGGGLILLQLLISRLIKENEKAVIHVDKNFTLNHDYHNNLIKIKFYNTFIKKVMLFGRSFDNALYFGNIPPFFSFGKKNYLYFHHPFYSKSYNYLLKNKYYKFILYKIYLSVFLINIRSVFVQIKNLSESFKREFGVIPQLMPFFEDLTHLSSDDRKIIYDFSYISLPNPNKNFELFLDSLLLLNKKLKKKIKIVLTIPTDNLSLIKKIEKLENSKIEIINIGIVSKDKVIDVLNSTKTLVFPSLVETFGLPLVEACQLNTLVLCSDLPYTYEVIKPSATFNPHSKEDIANTMFMSLEKKLKKPEIVIPNKIDDLIEILKK